MTDRFVKRKNKFASLKLLRHGNKNVNTKEKACPVCGDISDQRKKNKNICPVCGYHYPLKGKSRLKLIFDNGEYTEAGVDTAFTNPLDYPGYEDKIRELQEKTGLNDAIVAGTGTIGGYKALVFVMDARFLMGSMGIAVGEKISSMFEMAMKNHLPVIGFTASGGARMQEGILALMQMAKTSAVVEKFSRNGGLFISYYTNPTMGGVSASFASLGDITLAETGALVGFAGPRVIEQTIRQKLPEGFQRAEYLEQHGHVDAVVIRYDMKDTLIRILKLHCQERSS